MKLNDSALINRSLRKIVTLTTWIVRLHTNSSALHAVIKAQEGTYQTQINCELQVNLYNL